MINEWGPAAWYTIHSVCAYSTPSTRADVNQWLISTARVLPCVECQDEAKEYVGNHPPADAANIFDWSVAFHNFVNVRLGKRQISIKQARMALLHPPGRVPAAPLVGVVLAVAGVAFSVGRYVACPVRQSCGLKQGDE
jgi:hypothetical protein